MNQITDLRPISGLIHMLQLYLFQNKIADLSCLRNMQQLKYLDVSYNENLDIWGLQFLCGLQSLKITKCNVSDLSPIERLINLKSLQAVQNKMTQIKQRTVLVCQKQSALLNANELEQYFRDENKNDVLNKPLQNSCIQMSKLNFQKQTETETCQRRN
ncbi:Conserved_hypothetical protein [Hexamita inflata]|uniref:Uncharacterized protein n=1 Tax=Hexamita inflata TaxID=28002 RepID=A0AA86U499_9EUKA|nr:Conserved hypothetical protein [Hexamita inflata]